MEKKINDGLDVMKGLMEAGDKNSIEQLCKAVTLPLKDIPQFIEFMTANGWAHRFFSHEHRTESISLTEKNKREIQDTSKPLPPKLLRKFMNMFDTQERKMFFGHFFEKGDQWHLFHFSGASLEGNERGEFWGSRPHAHYLSSKHGWKQDDVLRILTGNGKGLYGEHIAVS